MVGEMCHLRLWPRGQLGGGINSGDVHTKLLSLATMECEERFKPLGSSAMSASTGKNSLAVIPRAQQSD